MKMAGRIFVVFAAFVCISKPTSAGMLTYYFKNDGNGLIAEDQLATQSSPTVHTILPPTTNSQDGFNAFIAALAGYDIGIEDFESFVGVGPQNPPNIPGPVMLDLEFVRLYGVGVLPITGQLNSAKALLVDMTLVDPATIGGQPVLNAAGRFPVTVPVGGTKYLDTNTEQLSFTIEFDTPVDAFGFFGTDFGDFDGQVQIQVTDGDGLQPLMNMPHEQTPINTTSVLNGSLLFFGFTSTSPISKVTFVGPDPIDRFGFDNLVVGIRGDNNTAVPEPASWIFFLGAFGLLPWGIRRIKAC